MFDGAIQFVYKGVSAHPTHIFELVWSSLDAVDLASTAIIENFCKADCGDTVPGVNSDLPTHSPGSSSPGPNS